MSKLPKVFLESHNLRNRFSGFGQFNLHLIKAIKKANPQDFKIVLHVRDVRMWKKELGDFFEYKRYFGFRRYKSVAVRYKYDVWHSLNQRTKIEPHADIPYVLTVHDVNVLEEDSRDPNHPMVYRLQQKLKRSDAITYISQFAKDSTHAYFEVPDVPEKVIYNGNTITDLKELTHTPKITSARPFLYCIGEFTDRKNFHTLVEMLVYTPEFDLILSGKSATDYNEEVLKPTIKKLGLEHRVFITGKISDEDKMWYYKHCEAFVFPSKREGFGIPPIEAMRYGKPIFLSNNTSLPEVGGDIAFFWNTFDAEYMAEVLYKGLETYKKDIENYKNSAVEHALSFNWDAAAAQYIEMYRTIIAQTKK